MGDTLRGVAEFFEAELRESLGARTESISTHKCRLTKLIVSASFRDLGPPDLCHVVKLEKGKANPREVSVPFFLTYPFQ